jgi:hypothetical protein
MSSQTELNEPYFHRAPLSKRLLQGGGIALILITIFLISAGEPNPTWPKLWMIRPLIMVPAAGAAGGLFYYLLDRMRSQGGAKKVLAVTLSIVVYIIFLWIGTVLGLDGTWWN